MFRWLKSHRRARLLHRFAIPDSLWHAATEPLAWLNGLGPEDWRRLRERTSLFLAKKEFSGAAGFVIDDSMRVAIAVQAAMVVLNLPEDAYQGWTTIIVYPGAFLARHTWQDDAGIEHREAVVNEGEVTPAGPVILSWEDSRPDVDPDALVVVHEMAHKLDPAGNGLPRLHKGMSRQDWTRVFSGAYEDLNRRLDAGEEPAIDPYAAENPAEFFAVMTEYFFAAPDILAGSYPDVYVLMRQFYRQDPLARLGRDLFPTVSWTDTPHPAPGLLRDWP